MLYIHGSDPPLDGVIRKVHIEDSEPYYSVLIAVTGQEKNTVRSHLRHKGDVVRKPNSRVDWVLLKGREASGWKEGQAGIPKA